MSCIDLKEQFLSYVDVPFQTSSSWTHSSFLKASTNALNDVVTLQQKLQELQLHFKRGTRLSRNKEQESNMLHNIKENMKSCEKSMKLINAMNVDLKSSNKTICEKFKNSIVVTLEMRFLKIANKFKQMYVLHSPQSSSEPQKKNAPNLSKSHFLEQSQEQIMEEVARTQYKEIQKSIVQISEMYKQTVSIVKMHEIMIESIQTNIDETEVNVERGKLNLSEAHRRQSKNRSIILKVFMTLYVTVFVYIVILS